MRARRAWNIAEHFTGSAFDHHHVVGSRNENSFHGGFDSKVVRPTFTFDIKLLDLGLRCA